MFTRIYFRRRWLAPLAASCGLLTAMGPVAAQEVTPAPNLATHGGGLNLRPPSAEDAPLASSSAPATTPSAAATTPNLPSAGASVAANTPEPSTAGPSTGGSPAPSQNVTINLINLMVKKNLISQGEADDLIRQAQQEADIAKAQAASTQAAAERALAAQAAQPPAAAPTPAPTDEVSVPYVPDVVKKQITDQVTQNVMEQTREEHLADTVAASQVPDWVKRFHVTGDIRVRYEGDMYPSGNAIGNFSNFNAINTSASGFNVNSLSSSFQSPQQYDVDQDRTRFRLRARLGAEVDLGQGFTVGLRLATGSDDNPVSENQTLGGANSAQGGDFGKYQIWLDRAFLRYELGAAADKDLTVSVGRFDNPFFHTSMLWADDLAFDGAVAQGKYEVVKDVTPFLTAGAFPIFNTDLNFSTYNAAKYHSEDKYLFAVQGGTTYKIDDFTLKGAGAFYDFENVQGRVSDPITTVGSSASGDTDDSRPSFAQNGNTYIALRDYTVFPGTSAEYQYFGLASAFRVVAVTGRVDYGRFDPFHMSLTGEFIKNVAFDRNEIVNGGSPSFPGPQNNTTGSEASSFAGGDTGYLVRMDFGHVALAQLWDWNLQLSYRYVQSDATVDGFTDSDFGGTLTGTNLKGYTLGGNLALSPRVWTTLRWMSADDVAGPTYHNDLIQFDINAKF